MILEGILTVVVALFGFTLGLKLYNKWKLNKLQEKFPEGTETKSKPVSRLDDIEVPKQTESVISKIAKEQDPVDPNEVMEKLLK